MLTINGSYGEGGGQLVRTAVGLSAVTGKPVTITNIRAARKKPGLAAQHIAAISAVAGTCSAGITGAKIGSRSLTFSPGEPEYQDLTVNVGTAGSIPLVIQAWLPLALCYGGRLRISGGTEVNRSPTIDYLDHVLAGILRAAGAQIIIEIVKRGYYPEGGGEVIIEVVKKNIPPIFPINANHLPVGIISCSSNLPDHVANRQASAAALAITSETGFPCTIEYDRRTGKSTGSSCTVYRGAKGGCANGRPGLPAEVVGENAAHSALAGFLNPADVDMHLSDQLLVPLALFGGEFTAPVLTSHADTVCWLLRQFGYTIAPRKGATVEFSYDAGA
ncbi:MAG: RNA 3'-terminal-phosphate cyclase [Methanoregula sp. PtaU1.Bin051]|nr:MAG: RNA 3'-terminal-phosphate cyclase [Methanoregula sp. PtaU1.Bin051]